MAEYQIFGSAVGRSAKHGILLDHQLVQDVTIRWNFTYYLMELLLEQKEAVSSYVTDHDLFNNALAASGAMRRTP